MFFSKQKNKFPPDDESLHGLSNNNQEEVLLS